MLSFDSFNLPASLVSAVQRLSFQTPTPIQAQAIPPALEGRDILGSAQTGTGKTAAYVIPLLNQLLKDYEQTALVLAPTRELAMQVQKAIRDMLPKDLVTSIALLIGGESIMPQLAKLRRMPRIVVGTPGRIIDHLERKTLDLSKVSVFVLDETDRMLDLGFGIQIDKIVAKLPQQRQTLMFSATLSPTIEKLAQKYLQEPERISTKSMAVEKIRQEHRFVGEQEKFGHLTTCIDENESSLIVFVKTRRHSAELAEKLQKLNYAAEAIHGDLRQRQRERVLQNFRSQKSRVLVATDVAARGLDIRHVGCVVNYHLPDCPEDFVHRIGRTGRAEAEGIAIHLISPQDRERWRAIAKLTNSGVEDKNAPQERHSPKAKQDKVRSWAKSMPGARKPAGRGASPRGDRKPHEFTPRSEQPLRRKNENGSQKPAGSKPDFRGGKPKPPFAKDAPRGKASQPRSFHKGGKPTSRNSKPAHAKGRRP